MTRQSKLADWLGAVVGAVSVLLVFAAIGHASDRQGKVTEEFHQVYPLAAEGRIDLENINGPVHITSWDRNEVKVDAVKRAWSKQRLDETRINIDSHSDSLSPSARSIPIAITHSGTIGTIIRRVWNTRWLCLGAPASTKSNW